MNTFRLVVLLSLAGCADGGGSSEVATVAEAIIGGRPSAADEDAAVLVETHIDGDRLYCSGTLVAPNLVLTARHCIVTQRKGTFSCTSSGELADFQDPLNYDLSTEAPENITISYGAHASAWRTVAAAKVVTPAELSICRNDIALLVLKDPLAAHYAPLRMEVPTVRSTFAVSSWGFTNDARISLPEDRSTRDDLQVTEVGPGLIPAGTFATSGGSLCFGDSGAGAMFDGAVEGVYSRIEADSCSSPQGRNVFMMIARQRELIERTFASIGATPWYAGQPPPWLAANGASCLSAEECQSGSCQNSRCEPREIPPRATADSGGIAPPPTDNTGGCSVGPTANDSAPILLWLTIACIVLQRRKGRRRYGEVQL